MVNKQILEKIFLEYVSIKSDTNTIYEKDVEKYLYDWLSSLSYFKDHLENYGYYKIKEDHLERSIVWGLVKGKGEKTIVLMHHHDVVDVFDYGKLARYAYKPNELERALKKKDLSLESKKDLESGEWIFGRGSADMKGGGAIQMALIEKYSNLKSFNGNLLFLSLPDEECLSAGMREGINLLEELKNRFNLQYALLINSEPHEREEKDTGVVHEGSVGKIMPVVYVRGCRAHVSDVFRGLNPILLLSEIVKRTELHSDFLDRKGSETVTPPSWMYFKDRKKVYDVSIPESVGGYLNILTLEKTPKQIMKELKNICEGAFEEGIDHVKRKYKAYIEKGSGVEENLPWKVNVKIFDEIYKEAMRDFGERFVQEYENTLKEIKEEITENGMNLCEGTFLLIEKTLEYVRDLSPVVVIGISPPYYPHVCNRDFEDLPEEIKDLNDRLNEYAVKNWNERVERKDYFMGISDLSYTALKDTEEVINYIGPNMPLWGSAYSIPFEKIKNLSIPSINIGPWGRDLHKFTERVHRKDLLERTPKLIEYAVKCVLGE